jgi:hypothetical protein
MPQIYIFNENEYSTLLTQKCEYVSAAIHSSYYKL